MTVSLAEEFALSCEIIVTVWNAPDFKIAPSDIRISPTISVRIIQTGDLHSRVPNPNGFRFREMRAKNVGIRRARGEFVLSTNPDDIFSSEMMCFLSARSLEHGHFYRANRHDTRSGEVYRICWPTGCKPVGASQAEIRTPERNAAPYAQNMLHFNASGDFLLMARDDWFLIHGNPERPYNHTVDGESVFLAHQKGLKQVILHYPIYHEDHERSLNIVPAGGFVGPSWDDNFPRTTENGDEWGFAGMEFPETIL
jgi:hypothetical protein